MRRLESSECPVEWRARRTRTSDLRVRSLVLYPAGLRAPRRDHGPPGWRTVAFVPGPILYHHHRAMIALVRSRAAEVVIVGAIGLTLCQGMIYTGLNDTDATTAGIIMALSPVMTMVLARAVLGEPLDLWKALGALLALYARLASLAFPMSAGAPFRFTSATCSVSPVAPSTSFTGAGRPSTQVSPHCVMAMSVRASARPASVST